MPCSTLRTLNPSGDKASALASEGCFVIWPIRVMTDFGTSQGRVPLEYGSSLENHSSRHG
jgi:hypothetical protein